MNLYDDVNLLEEIHELSQKGTHKNCYGVLVEDNGEECLVCFLNPNNMGEFAEYWKDKGYKKDKAIGKQQEEIEITVDLENLDEE